MLKKQILAALPGPVVYSQTLKANRPLLLRKHRPPSWPVTRCQKIFM